MSEKGKTEVLEERVRQERLELLTHFVYVEGSYSARTERGGQRRLQSCPTLLALQLFFLQKQFITQISVVAHLLDLQVFSGARVCFFLVDANLSVKKPKNCIKLL